jgi:hypothetical protein
MNSAETRFFAFDQIRYQFRWCVRAIIVLEETAEVLEGGRRSYEERGAWRGSLLSELRHLRARIADVPCRQPARSFWISSIAAAPIPVRQLRSS